MANKRFQVYDFAKIKEADDAEFNIHFTLDGSDIDISSWTVYFTVKDDVSDDTPLISRELTSHSKPTEGKTNWQLTASETEDLAGVYWAEIKVKKGDGTQKTYIEGKLPIAESITGLVN